MNGVCVSLMLHYYFIEQNSFTETMRGLAIPPLLAVCANSIEGIGVKCSTFVISKRYTHTNRFHALRIIYMIDPNYRYTYVCIYSIYNCIRMANCLRRVLVLPWLPREGTMVGESTLDHSIPFGISLP
jgi:hypothetical protein